MTWLRSLREVLHVRGVEGRRQARNARKYTMAHPQSSHISTITAIRAGGRRTTRKLLSSELHAESTRRQYQLREHRLNRGRPARTAWTLILDGHLMTPKTKNVRASGRRATRERDARGIHTESTNCIPLPGNQRTPNTSRTDPDSGRH